jgi:hypothetical protein
VLILDTRREKKDGKYSVKIQVVQNGKQRFYSTGKSLSVDEREKLPESKSKILSNTRRNLENSFSLIKSNVEPLVNEHEFTFDALNLRLGKGTDHTLNTAFQAKIESLLKKPNWLVQLL